MKATEERPDLFRREALEEHRRGLSREGEPLHIRPALKKSTGWLRIALFTTLSRLRPSRSRRRLPYVQQTTTADCGAACLAMVLEHFGKSVRLEDVRQVLGTGSEGVNALLILDAARWFGLRGRGIRIEIKDLEFLPAGTILHWKLNHFVVFEAVGKNGVDVVDPAIGHRRVSMDQFSRFFTGVALTFEPGETFQPAGAKRSRLSSYLRQILGQKGILSGVLGTSILVQLCALAMPLLTGVLVDRIVPHRDYQLLVVLLIGAVSMAGFSVLAGMVRSYLLLQLRTQLDQQLTQNFLEHLVGLPYLFFQQRSAGDLMNRMSSNAVVREVLTSAALSGILDGALVSLYLILMFARSAPMGALVLVLGLLRVTLFLFTRRRFRDLMSESLQTQAVLQNYQVQLLAGIETLKASGAEQRAVERWSNHFVDALNVSLERGRLGIRVDALMGSLGALSPLLVLGYGGMQVLAGNLSLGTMLALSALAGGVLGPLSSLVTTSLQLQEMGSYLDRLNDIMDTPLDQERAGVSRAAKLEGHIVLENVSFRYGPLSPPAVQDVSLEIKTGEFVAIVGASGSGKSTLAHLILGLYVPISGAIKYDGVDLNRLDAHTVRRQLGIVPQHPYLFGQTIRENILLTDPARSLDDVIEAARLAEIHEDIRALPMGYDTVLADGGASLAAGQRQRIALARALVHKPAILLLDEATSALDALTEIKVLNNLAALRCARIVIAHRLSTIVRADRIVVMEQGRAVEQGTHAGLMAVHGSYARLVGAQIDPQRSPKS